jgi:hypothetical protein
MTVSTKWRLALELSLLPNEFIISIQDDKVVNIGRRNEVLLSSGAGVDTPSSEENDIRTTDVSSVAVTR